ncbi:hypothetical protein [Nocardioides sp. Leaf285]|uniref:hypothetical protein n=1 Tax=Nocardioides sp. Leaf285 TaxID=1736322 RepID=UPI000703898F|nr:hypothetical protein [Nocardioides sp. Leaf285]KQP63009.1 hypothetical protein ASF47_18530 [Nocardioides sp. Leaf285]
MSSLAPADFDHAPVEDNLAGIDDLGEIDLDAPIHPDEPEDPTATDTEALGKSAQARPNNRALIRRVANKAQEILDTDTVVRSMTAGMLGVTDNVGDLTLAIMTADRTCAQPIDDLYRIAEADSFEAATVTGALGRERMKAVWALLDAFDAAPSATVPASNPKAALALAKHVLTKIDMAELRTDLDRVLALLRKN